MLPNKINLGPGIMNLSGCRLIPSPTDRPLWVLGSDKITDVSAGPAYYIDNNLEMQTIAAENPLWVDGKLWNVGSWKEYCLNPKTPYSLSSIGSPTIESLSPVGSFTPIRISGTSAHYGKYIVGLTTSLSKQLYVSVLYKIDTSNTPVLSFRDKTVGANSSAVMDSTGWATSSVPSVGFITIISDEEILPGVRLLRVSMEWTTLGNSQYIYFAAGSTIGESVILYGAMVNELGDIWPVFNPTGGSITTTRQGTAYFDLTSDSNAQLKTALYGSNGTDAAAQLTFDWRPYYNSSSITSSKMIFKTNSRIVVKDAMSGNITLSDGTNTATAALTSWAAKDVIKFKMVWGNNHPDYTGVNKMQLSASKDGGVTWINSPVVNFYGSMIASSDQKFFFGGDAHPHAVSNVKIWKLKSGDWPT